MGLVQPGKIKSCEVSLILYNFLVAWLPTNVWPHIDPSSPPTTTTTHAHTFPLWADWVNSCHYTVAKVNPRSAPWISKAHVLRNGYRYFKPARSLCRFFTHNSSGFIHKLHRFSPHGSSLFSLAKAFIPHKVLWQGRSFRQVAKWIGFYRSAGSPPYQAHIRNLKATGESGHRYSWRVKCHIHLLCVNTSLVFLLLLGFRAAGVWVSQRGWCDVVGSQRGVGGRKRHQLSANRGHQNCKVGYRPASWPQHLCVHAVNLPNWFYIGKCF